MKDGRLDRADISLLHVLMRDSRASIEDISAATSMIASSIGGRIDAMRDSGVLRRFTTRPSLASLGASSVLVWGRSRMNSMEVAVRQATASDRVAWLAQSTSGRFYLALHLQKAGELEKQLRIAEADAMMLRPAHAIRRLFQFDHEPYPFDALDWRIIECMKNEPAMRAEDAASYIGAKMEEVEDHLERMIASGALDFSVDLDLNNISNPLCMFHLEGLDPNGAEVAVGELMQGHAPSFLFFNTYSNMPQLTTAVAIAQDWDELKGLARAVQGRAEFPFTEVSPILSSTTLETWRDKMVRKKGAPTRK